MLVLTEGEDEGEYLEMWKPSQGNQKEVRVPEMRGDS